MNSWRSLVFRNSLTIEWPNVRFLKTDTIIKWHSCSSNLLWNFLKVYNQSSLITVWKRTRISEHTLYILLQPCLKSTIDRADTWDSHCVSVLGYKDQCIISNATFSFQECISNRNDYIMLTIVLMRVKFLCESSRSTNVHSSQIHHRRLKQTLQH